VIGNEEVVWKIDEERIELQSSVSRIKSFCDGDVEMLARKDASGVIFRKTATDARCDVRSSSSSCHL
jgi:hypothetical protein